MGNRRNARVCVCVCTSRSPAKTKAGVRDFGFRLAVAERGEKKAFLIGLWIKSGAWVEEESVMDMWVRGDFGELLMFLRVV